MKSRTASHQHDTRRFLPAACAAALAVTLMAALPQLALAANIEVPPIPDNLKLPDGNHPYLLGHGVGTQNYVCAPSASSSTGVAYALFTPEATLFNDDFKELTTHFFSPNPFETNGNPALVADGPIRATWQATDTSTVWAQVKKDKFGKDEASTDPRFVEKGAVAWLKLTIVGQQNGLTGGDRLSPNTTFIHRLSTSGGVAPATGCASGSDLGNQAFVPYSADYFFYTDQE
jgi:hypothetical protein